MVTGRLQTVFIQLVEILTVCNLPYLWPSAVEYELESEL